MYISEIKQLKNGRYGLFADDKFLLSLDEETLLLSGIKADTEIDDGEFEELILKKNLQRAKDKAMVLLSYRDHSKEELKRKIARTSGEEAAEVAAHKMEELGLVDDALFAEKFARDLFYHRFYGSLRVKHEMALKGLDKELIEQTIENINPDEEALICQYLSKKYPRGITDEKIRNRASASLARNGYSWDNIRQVMKEYTSEEFSDLNL